MIRGPAPHTYNREEAAQYGREITGSRWFRGEPLIVEGRWKCPLTGCPGLMVFTGWEWPMSDPGLHHACTDCGFTAAITGKKYDLRHGPTVPKN